MKVTYTDHVKNEKMVESVEPERSLLFESSVADRST